jgi:alpha-ketoglutarate-dependent taurine dioxygenase
MKKNSLESLLSFKPKEIDPNEERVVWDKFPGLEYPEVVKTTLRGTNLELWMTENKDQLTKVLRDKGAILFRGFEVFDNEKFRNCFKVISSDFLDYTDRSSPRSEIGGNVYTSTEHPQDQVINMHNELSYSQSWPQWISFYCHAPAPTGGETPIADVRKVLEYLSLETKEMFKAKGLLYRRLLQKGIGLSWQQVFQTESKEEMEANCQERGIRYRWLGEDKVVITWKKDAIICHPKTNEELWFNHGYFFNEYTLTEDVRLAFDNVEELPFNTFFGDGTDIPHQMLEEIGLAYEKARLKFLWQKGDLLIMDNMLMAHGRESFSGERSIRVLMAEAISQDKK